MEIINSSNSSPPTNFLYSTNLETNKEYMLYINEKIKFIATYLGRRYNKNNLLYFHIIKNLKDVKYLSNYDEDIKESYEPQLFVLHLFSFQTPIIYKSIL